jgi:thiol-disulfide isomerase/thioredoxin
MESYTKSEDIQRDFLQLSKIAIDTNVNYQVRKNATELQEKLLSLLKKTLTTEQYQKLNQLLSISKNKLSEPSTSPITLPFKDSKLDDDLPAIEINDGSITSVLDKVKRMESIKGKIEEEELKKILDYIKKLKESYKIMKNTDNQRKIMLTFTKSSCPKCKDFNQELTQFINQYEEKTKDTDDDIIWHIIDSDLYTNHDIVELFGIQNYPSIVSVDLGNQYMSDIASLVVDDELIYSRNEDFMPIVSNSFAYVDNDLSFNCLNNLCDGNIIFEDPNNVILSDSHILF